MCILVFADAADDYARGSLVRVDEWMELYARHKKVNSLGWGWLEM